MTANPDARDAQLILLLRTVAALCGGEVAESLQADMGLSARVRVAAHLLETTARQLEEGPALAAERRERLTRMLYAEDAPDLEALECRLVERLRDPTPMDPGDLRTWRGYLLDSLRADLRLLSPRFDTRLRPDTPRDSE